MNFNLINNKKMGDAENIKYFSNNAKAIRFFEEIQDDTQLVNEYARDNAKELVAFLKVGDPEEEKNVLLRDNLNFINGNNVNPPVLKQEFIDGVVDSQVARKTLWRRDANRRGMKPTDTYNIIGNITNEDFNYNNTTPEGQQYIKETFQKFIGEDLSDADIPILIKETKINLQNEAREKNSKKSIGFKRIFNEDKRNIIGKELEYNLKKVYLRNKPPFNEIQFYTSLLVCIALIFFLIWVLMHDFSNGSKREDVTWPTLSFCLVSLWLLCVILVGIIIINNGILYAALDIRDLTCFWKGSVPILLLGSILFITIFWVIVGYKNSDIDTDNRHWSNKLFFKDIEKDGNTNFAIAFTCITSFIIIFSIGYVLSILYYSASLKKIKEPLISFEWLYLLTFVLSLVISLLSLIN